MRRGLVAVLVVVLFVPLVSGCVARTVSTVYDGHVRPDTKQVVDVAADEPRRLRVHFDASGALDVLVLAADDFAAYEEGRSFTAHDKCSKEKVAGGTWSCRLGDGAWSVVFDATAAGKTPAPTRTLDLRYDVDRWVGLRV